MRDLGRQLDYLKNYGEFIDVDAAVHLMKNDRFEGRYFLVTFDDGYRDTVQNALPVLVEKAVPAVMFVISGYLTGELHELRADVNGKFLDRQGCLRWTEAGMAIGSHTHTHRRLAELSEDEVLRELVHSRSVLSDLLGTFVTHFACPWGSPGDDFHAHRDPMLAAQAGFSSFFTTVRGPARAAGDVFNMPRDVIEPTWSNWQLKYFFGR
ncbi:polysaccharide deacetylase family protein [Microvirga pudoricolor]|uniref:polysaccharide deacetylase family protein n=1 Tax=Microvirga pudoricolor TaxID=2778729 RepID=UPI0019507C6F|nr:polysaccharide deacetylase family protein [Microvirga pudoricolor]MBM6593011.1 polysaccharide deacetylase family protein [Microvirga pudoricolor]